MLKKIIKKLQTNQFPHLTWIGKNYNKADLINELTEVHERLSTIHKRLEGALSK
ncbi:hypothetical protein LCGC14_1662710 [marine sediment metagenome]|uniref:Uncharacterized protein n=1 Tax=marine sediment metagenome TaxID=412755 RepID=A0A0F9HUB1_9ZZZZ